MIDDSGSTGPSPLVAATRRIWDAKAEFWDALMGDSGNVFHRTVVAPAQLALLAPRPTDVVLDVACGNGLASRDMAPLVRRVVGCDISPRMIELATQRAQAAGLANVEYQVVDATDEHALRALGEGGFDAVVCSMALMDIPAIEPLLRASRWLLAPEGRFVFSLCHPCFNHHGARMVEELDDRDGALIPSYAVKISKYMNMPPQRGMGARGEPEPHYYFHRTLAHLFQACFAAGLVLDGLEESAFPSREPDRHSFDWANYAQIPPVLVARLRVGSER